MQAPDLGEFEIKGSTTSAPPQPAPDLGDLEIKPTATAPRKSGQSMKAPGRPLDPDRAPGGAENPLQEQGVSFQEREEVKWFGPDKASAVEWLRRKPGEEGKPEEYGVGMEGSILGKIKTGKLSQYDAHLTRKGQIAIRPAGSSEPFKVIDPNTGFFSKDFLRDAADLVPEGIQAAFPATKALKVAGVAGASELVRRGIATQRGFKGDTVGKALHDAALNAVTAGTAAKVLPAIPRALRAPRKFEKWITAEGPKQNLASAEAKALKEAAERAKGLPEHISRGAKVAEETAPALRAGDLPTPTPTASSAAAAGIVTPVERAGFNIPPGVLHPATGMTAAQAEVLPEFAQIGQKWFGPDFLRATGSKAMKTRERDMGRLARTKNTGERDAIVQGYSKDIGQWMLGSPVFKGMDQAGKEAATRAAAGKASTADLARLEELVSQALKGAGQSPEVLAAKAALAKAVANPTRQTLAKVYRYRRWLIPSALAGGVGVHPVLFAMLGIPLATKGADIAGKGIQKGAEWVSKLKYGGPPARAALRALPYLAPDAAEEAIPRRRPAPPIE